eukprot:SAG22_NODE_432_length_10559_cov_29.404225_6_plen_76_part_00
MHRVRLSVPGWPSWSVTGLGHYAPFMMKKSTKSRKKTNGKTTSRLRLNELIITSGKLLVVSKICTSMNDRPSELK